MIYSANEISSLFRKAGIGAGLPVGVAEDISRAGLWLLERGLSGDEAILKGIQGLNMYDPSIDINAQTVRVDRVCAALHGPSLFDLAATKVDVFQARLLQVDCSLLLVGLAGIAVEDYGLETEIKFAEDLIVEVTSSGSITNGALISGQVSNIHITCRHSEAQGSAETERLSSFELNEEGVKKLLKLAAKTYVPATEASREKGAGAGLTDND